MRAHRLKTWPAAFRAIRDGWKTCELRKADRDFQVGDYLLLIEFDPKEDQACGDYIYRRVTHIVQPGDPPNGLVEGFVILSIEECSRVEKDALQGNVGFLPDVIEWLDLR